MGDPAEPRSDSHWHLAVWALRAGYAALLVAFAGLILTLMGLTPWVLAAGELLWLAAAAVTAVGFRWFRNDLPAPRPRPRLLLSKLVHDSVHSSSAMSA